MKLSLNEIKQLGYPELVERPVEELVEIIGAQLGAVEDVEELGAKYQGVVVAQVVNVSKHLNADRLSVCLIDDGGAVKEVARDENGRVQVVCGAPNVREGLLVAWLPPGAVVPETYHHEAPFRLEARELRGVVSNGMLASAKELALGDDHQGILEIDADVEPGQVFADVYHLDDSIIDIENKMFTHRPDCFGLLGIARELAGIQHKQFVSPDWYTSSARFAAVSELKLEADNHTPELAPRFMALALKDITVKPSPLWLQTALIRLGSRPINNVVDITNYLMLITGQPLHSYDYDKVGSGKLGVRLGGEGEQLDLLNGKRIEVTAEDIVITDGHKAIGLAGVMGGRDTEVDQTTTKIILGVATFDMYAVRRASMRHGLFTDAVTRFNKGQSPIQNDRVLGCAVQLLADWAGAEPASQVCDLRHDRPNSESLTVSAEFINQRLGLELTAEDMASLLKNVEFQVEIEDSHLTLAVPFWRRDIVIPEDVVEEVGRLHGYSKLPAVLPLRNLRPVKKNQLFETKQRLRRSLAAAGANEVLTYSFVPGKLMVKSGQDPAEAFQLANALSPELQYYRLSLMPSLLGQVRPNLKAGYDNFALFEIGKFHNAKLHADDDGGLPREFTTVDLIYSTKDSLGAAYYQARRLLDWLADDWDLEISLKPLDKAPGYALTEPFDYSRSAFIYSGDDFLGIVGEFTIETLKNFKIPAGTAGFSLDIEMVSRLTANASSRYRPLSRYPGTERDLTFRVEGKVAFSAIAAALDEARADSRLETSVMPLGIFQKDGETAKNVSFRLKITDPERTITAETAAEFVETVASRMSDKLGVILV